MNNEGVVFREDTSERTAFSKNIRLFAMCFIALLTTAFFFAVRAQIIDAIQIEFDLTETQKGWLLGAGMWPFALGIIGFSLVVDRIGYKISLTAAFIIHIISILMVLFGANFWWLFFGTLLVAIGNGAVEAVVNPAVVSIFKKAKTKWINILHAGWAVGIMLGSLISLAISDRGVIGQQFAGGLDWRWTFGIILIPAFIYGIMLIKAQFPMSERILAGVSFRDMLREMGIVGFFIVIFLVVREIINILTNIGAAFVGASDYTILGATLVITIVLMIPIGLYIRSFGRGLFIILMLLMFPLATTELGTDAWIKDLMNPVMESNFGLSGGWVLVYSSLVMMILRFNAGPIVKRLGPLGLMITSSVAAAIGLVFIGNVSGIWIVVAATVYAIGQTFFWPTTIGIVGEQFPKGGALTLNSITGVGMIGVGILGTPLLGLIQDKKINEQLEQQNVTVYEKVVTLEKQSIYGHYKAFDPYMIQQLDEEEKTLIEKIRRIAKKHALTIAAIVPLFMGICFSLLALWFKRKGGYKPVELTHEARSP